ncbi:bifunctional hydroxymethylpyrimidine kinase/phosphomethylpyrimidine kinase [Elizabethkingia sp. JS20170427COW]|uniref:bifunctional hydroxymethylpyrimidine kinase/phosphomethylpyrimidine kinase n=1 Tax=Elizabethkingia sp. JS20170427COW TaxID=2583851 RepID=UPI0011106CBA|nr:bifunctional hydroxymethylpyrimidine kinase/phosphomethylpyrimidine kinase [Elizabethkingia sp. JS20170427COW]QCX54180.1 bifunctional hydroxymethylpyrimidine kinase/phosphomethylpyrimidine kinase [Elizabethkingia sp. JS20170427COW]
MKMYQYPSVLTIAGFDGSGGAGQQADIKAISALGCYSTCVLTSLPIQNTQGVQKIYPIPLEAIEEQIAAVMDDVFPNAIKIGMIHSAELARVVAKQLSKYPKVPVVYDPVMVASSGDKLIKDEDIEQIIDILFPISDLITPNIDEAAVLAKMKVETEQEMLWAGEQILKYQCKAVLLKGGHQKTEILSSYLLTQDHKSYKYESQRIETKNTHGSGCTLSSAIASYLARGEALHRAVELGQQYVFEAIKSGQNVLVGKGTGSLNHFFNPQKLIKNELDRTSLDSI